MGFLTREPARPAPLLLYCLLWPGFPQLWVDGSWSGLAMAAGYAAIVNLAVVSTVVWTEWVGSLFGWLIWLVVGGGWCAGVYVSLGWLANRPRADSLGSGAGDLFPQALHEYLQGNWFKSESLCREALRHNARDVDAGLLLATTLRRAGRLEEARAELVALERWDDARKWQWEIRQEFELIAEWIEEAGSSLIAAEDEQPAQAMLDAA